MKLKFKILFLITVLSIVSWIDGKKLDCTFEDKYLTDCCSFLKSDPDHKGCYDGLFDSKKHSNKEYICAKECFMKAHFGYRNYSFDPQVVEDYFKRLYPERRDKNMLMKVNRIFKFCEEEVKNLSQKFDAIQYKTNQCSIYPFLVSHCISYEAFVHCPKNRFNPTEACSDAIRLMTFCTYNGTLGIPVDDEERRKHKSFAVDTTTY